MQRRPVPAIQYGGVAGTADWQRRSRLASGIPEGLLPESSGPVDRANDPFGRQPQSSAAGGHVQRAEYRNRHQSELDDESEQRGRSGEHNQPPLRCKRQPDREPVAAEERRLWRGHGLSKPANSADPAAVGVLRS